MNKKIENKIPKVAVIGCGYWGKNLVRNFAELGALISVCDDNDDLAISFAEQYKVNVSTFKNLMEDQTIDGVVLATPAVLHAQQATQALESGKHVFVEKPLALTVEEATEVMNIAKKKERILMVGHLLQYHPVFLKLKEMIKDGELGKIQHINSHRLNLGKMRSEENILWSFAPHDISMILSLIGSEPDSVSAVGNFYLNKTIADITSTHLSFPGGENANIFVSWLHPYKEQKLVIVGDKAMAVFDDTLEWSKKLLVYPHRIEWKNGVPVPDKAEAKSIEIEKSEPLKNEAQHFLDCISGKVKCRTDGEEAIRVLRVLQASERAISKRQTVLIDG